MGMGLLARLRALLSRGKRVRYHTMFGTALVYETTWQGDRLRVLDVEGTYQSATYLDERWCDLPFAYLAGYDYMFETGLPMRDVCMLGGGGYAYPKHVIAHHPHTRIDVVEIDPIVTQVAREHFFLDRLCEEYRTDATGRLGIVCDDARSYLATCSKTGRRYDAILNDCFAAEESAGDLMTPEAAELVHRCLMPRGIYLANVVSALEGTGARPLVELVSVLGAEFAHVYTLPMGTGDATEPDNVLVVAVD